MQDPRGPDELQLARAKNLTEDLLEVVRAEHGKARALLQQQQMELHQAQMQYAAYSNYGVRVVLYPFLCDTDIVITRHMLLLRRLMPHHHLQATLHHRHHPTALNPPRPQVHPLQTHRWLPITRQPRANKAMKTPTQLIGQSKLLSLLFFSDVVWIMKGRLMGMTLIHLNSRSGKQNNNSSMHSASVLFVVHAAAFILSLGRYYASQGYAANTANTGETQAPPPPSTAAPPPPPPDAQPA